jgi:hypothetical protein
MEFMMNQNLNRVTLF